MEHEMQTGLYSGVVKIVGLLRGRIIVKPEKGLSLGNRHMGNRRNNYSVVHLFLPAPTASIAIVVGAVFCTIRLMVSIRHYCFLSIVLFPKGPSTQ